MFHYHSYRVISQYESSHIHFFLHAFTPETWFLPHPHPPLPLPFPFHHSTLRHSVFARRCFTPPSPPLIPSPFSLPPLIPYLPPHLSPSPFPSPPFPLILSSPSPFPRPHPLSPPLPSHASSVFGSINAALEVVFLRLTQAMSWPADQIIVMGRSLGSGPAARLAREFHPGVRIKYTHRWLSSFCNSIYFRSNCFEVFF